MTRQILVVGLGTFGSMVARELASLGHEVMGADRDTAAVADIVDDITQAVELDAADPEALDAIGPREFDVAVVALDRPSSILATMLLEQAGVGTIVARASGELDAEILRRVGADRVVLPEHEVATWLAHTIDLAGAVDFIRLSGDHAAVHLRLRDRSAGRTVGELAQAAPQLRIVALTRGGHVTIEPGPDTVLAAGDSILVVGPEGGFRALSES